MSEGTFTKEELRQRVIYSMLLPAARLARAFGMPLKELRGWLDAAYFQELRGQGLTQREIAEVLQVSERTAVSLSRNLREAFLRPELSHNLTLRIEFILGAEAMGEGRLGQVLPEVAPEVVRAALDDLIAQGRVREVRGRTVKYEPAAPVRRLARDSWMDRIGALNSLGDNLANAVYGRFFRSEPRAFARTLTFRGNRVLFDDLTKFYEEVVLPGLRSLHVNNEDGDAVEAAQVSLCWAPYEYMNDLEEP